MKIIKHLRSLHRLLLLLSVFFVYSCSSGGGESLDLRSRIKKITLDNGLTVLMLRRDGAPVFSSEIQIKVGNIEEQTGSRGLAHFFEHMAFKGTDTIGTKDFGKEKLILDKIYEVGTKLVELKKNGGSPEQIAALLKERKELESEQKKYIEQNEFMEIYQKNGSVDLNATTSNDFTTYYVSLPVNKMELWAHMESARLMHPVMREFFTEVDVVAEERRMRIDNTPSGRLYEAFMGLAFDKSPYKTMVIGPAEDIQNYTPDVAKKFYETYYIPSRMVISIVGNIDFTETERIVRQYFSKIPAKNDPKPAFVHEEFDSKTFPREKTITGPENPRFYFGYHRPAHPDRDDIVMDVIRDILCEGRTSRLFKKLILDKKMASYVGCYAAVPGGRLDSIFSFYALPLNGFKNQDLKKEIISEIEKLAAEGPTEKELQQVKNKIDAELIYSLQSNSGLASQLSYYESLTGSWEYIYYLQDRMHTITADDVKKAIKKHFVKEHESTVYFEQEST